jgi:hypothetical protein
MDVVVVTSLHEVSVPHEEVVYGYLMEYYEGKVRELRPSLHRNTATR